MMFMGFSELSFGDENYTCPHCGNNDHEPGCPDGAIVAAIAEDYECNGCAALNRHISDSQRNWNDRYGFDFDGCDDIDDFDILDN